MNNEKSKHIYEKRRIIGWALYDWANSAFAITIMAGFFPIFFKEYCNYGVDKVDSTWRWALANSLAGVTVAILAPILGAVADKGSSRKKFLMFFAFMGVVMTAGLSLTARGNWLMAWGLYIVATIGFSGGNIFYDSLIVSVASEKKLDVVSGLGYALGYLGGGVLFTLIVWMTLKPETFGLANTEQAVKVSFLCVSIWWAVFSVPLFLFVKEPIGHETRLGIKAVKAGLIQLKTTFKKIRQSKVIFIFLVAYWFYIDGVDTIIRMAVDYGNSIQMDNKVLITSVLILNFVGFPAALGFGYLGQRIGAKRGIFLAIGVYLVISVWGAFIKRDVDFYILAVTIGLVQGGIQSLSRSFFARLIPLEQSAEYFGFYNMLGKFAVVIGPVLIGGVGLMVKSMGYDSMLASRVSITSIALLFLIGGTLLFFVKEQKPKDEFNIEATNSGREK